MSITGRLLQVYTNTTPHAHYRCTVWTTSPAVTEKPRDASCLSVVSFNSAVFYYYYIFGFTFTTACNKMLLCCRRDVDWFLVVNTSSSSPVKNKFRRLLATSVNNLPWFVAAECIALGSRTNHSTRWRHILAENRCIRRPR